MSSDLSAGQGSVAGTESAGLFRRARQVSPGGVHSPVRAFRGVGGNPLFVDRAAGARIWDVDGRAYIDYMMSWGALLLGHGHPAVVEAVEKAARLGTSYGAPCAGEVELAELVADLVPSIEMVRFVNSGTEATMSAVRLARAVTGRDLVVKFSGCYHGHADGFLVQAGSGVATLGLPDSPGVPEPVANLTLSLPFNDLSVLESCMAELGQRIACVILEPVMGNAGLIEPVPGFLEGVRKHTGEHGALLIFDEVMTGFRVAAGGAQERFGVEPDLTVLGKVMGGGLPVGAYGGGRDLMEQIAPAGPVYQAGTLSGNPLAMAAGIAQLSVIQKDKPFEELERKAGRLVEGIVEEARGLGVAACGSALGGMWGVHFVEPPVLDYEDVRRGDQEFFSRFFQGCLRRGVYLAPSAFEAGFVSVAHGDAEIRETLEVCGEALREAAG